MPDRPTCSTPTCSTPGCRNYRLTSRDTCGLCTPRKGPVKVLSVDDWDKPALEPIDGDAPLDLYEGEIEETNRLSDERERKYGI